MNATFKIDPADIANLERELRARSDLIGKDLQTVINEEARLLLRDAINFTPPLAKGSNDFQTVAPRIQRLGVDEAIQRETRGAFISFEDLIERFTPKSKRGGKTNYARVRNYLNQYAGQNRLAAITKMLRDFGWKKFEVQSSATEEAYKARQRKWKGARPIIVLKKETIDPLVKRLVAAARKKVGLGKSGWNRSASALGLRVPSWVTGKAGDGGFSRENSLTGYALTMLNAVKHVQKNPDAIVGRAIRRRTRSLISRTEKILERRSK